MNKHLCNFIQFITSHPGESLKFSELAAQMDVSVRMIRNYCTGIEEFLGNELFHSLFQLNQSSILYAGNQKQTEELTSIIHNTDFYNYKLSRKERLQVISLLMLLSHAPITIGQLEEFLYVSRGTLLKDLEILQNDFQKNHLYFTKNKSRGFLLECTEEQKRNAVFQILSDIHPLDQMFFSQRYNICLGFVNRFLKLEKYYPRMETLLQNTEKHFSIQFSDQIFYCLLLYLCVISLRLDEHCFVETIQSSSRSELPVTIAEYLIQNMMSGAPCNENEVLYLANLLKENFSLHLQEQQGNEAVRFQIVIRQFLTALSHSYNEDLTLDSHLLEYLPAHLMGTYHRLSHQEHLQNPLKEQMLTEFPQDFSILRQHLHILEKEMGYPINDDEAAYILMHIVSAIQKLYRQEHILEVIIACNSGMGTANFLAENIRKHIQAKIISITSIHNLAQLLSRQKADFIISTVPLRGCQLPWIQVHTIPTKEDILAIQSLAAEISEKLSSHRQKICREKTVLPKPEFQPTTSSAPLSFSRLLTPNHILLNREVHDWKEAIITAGEPLLFEKKISCDYLNAMVSSIIENGPYIVFAPGIALAHANPCFGVQDIGVSLLRLSKPVSFGHTLNDPVHIVVALAMLESASHINVLFHIMNILCNRYAFLELLNAQDEKQIISIIEKYEKTSVDLIPDK